MIIPLGITSWWIDKLSFVQSDPASLTLSASRSLLTSLTRSSAIPEDLLRSWRLAENYRMCLERSRLALLPLSNTQLSYDENFTHWLWAAPEQRSWIQSLPSALHSIHHDTLKSLYNYARDDPYRIVCELRIYFAPLWILLSYLAAVVCFLFTIYCRDVH